MQVFQSGQLILGGTYCIEQLLGRGAFGEVYLVVHQKLNIPRAIKVIRKGEAGLGSTEFEQYRERFTVEARLGATLRHQNIIHVDDFREEENELFLIMDYASKGSLAGKIEEVANGEEAIPIEKAVRWTTEAAEGLARLHSRDIVHRDIKPSNILLDSEEYACLADLGLVQLPTSRLEGSSFGFNHPGTPEYMPPEQRPGNFMPLRASADIYALGCVLFELLTGRQYYQRPEGTRVSSIRTETPQWLDELVGRTLDPVAKNRPFDAGEFLAEIKNSQQKKSIEVKQPEISKPAEAVNRSLGTQIARSEKLSEYSPVTQLSENEIKIELGSGVSMEFVRVPAGKFWMGSDPKVDRAAQKDEQPQHRVYQDEYWIGKYPVTHLQYQIFLQRTNRESPQNWSRDEFPAEKADHPVVYVSWQDAEAFCNWLSIKTKREIALPTEAQWEKAARGTDRRIYPWGNQAPDAILANYNGNDTTKVGSYPAGASPYGALDMAGNVWEWVADWYSDTYYSQSPTNNPTGPASGQNRSRRGGSWYDSEYYIRSAFRDWDNPSITGLNLGFRCSLSVSVSP